MSFVAGNAAGGGASGGDAVGGGEAEVGRGEGEGGGGEAAIGGGGEGEGGGGAGKVEGGGGEGGGGEGEGGGGKGEGGGDDGGGGGGERDGGGGEGEGGGGDGGGKKGSGGDGPCTVVTMASGDASIDSTTTPATPPAARAVWRLAVLAKAPPGAPSVAAVAWAAELLLITMSTEMRTEAGATVTVTSLAETPPAVAMAPAIACVREAGKSSTVPCRVNCEETTCRITRTAPGGRGDGGGGGGDWSERALPSSAVLRETKMPATMAPTAPTTMTATAI